MKSNKEIKDQLSFDNSEHKKDKELYELLFQQLEQEKEILIKPNFSSQVIRQIEIKRKKETRRENTLFGIAIGSVLFFSFLIIKVIISLENSSSFLPTKVFLPAIGLVALIVTFQVIDNNLLRRRRVKRHLEN